MKKKVVALLTLAMFVMTLLPVGAFAAAPGEARPENSSVEFEFDDPTVDINEAVKVTTKMFVDEEQTDASSMKDVRIWVTNEKGNTVKNAKIGKLDENDEIIGDGWTQEYGVVKLAELDNDVDFGVSVATSGVYTLHVGQQQVDADDETVIAEVDYENGNTFTVNAQEEDRMLFDGKDADDNDVYVVSKSKLDAAGFEYNGVDTYTVEGQLLDENGKAMRDKDVTLSSNKDNLELEEETVTTDRNGKFDIEFSLDSEVNASITVAYGDLEYTIKVEAGDNDLDTINTTKDGGYVLAGKDKKWDVESKVFSDAVQFEILDENGDVVENANLAAEPAAYANDKNHEKYVKVKAPSNSSLESEDLALVWDNEEECYTLFYTGDKTSAKKDLVEGKYSVTVALKSGSKATATFNVAKFGDVQDLVVKTYYANKKSGGKIATDKEIALGDQLIVEVKYVDENGIQIEADDKNIRVGADGKAIKEQLDDYRYMLKANATVNESLIGTTIKVTAFDDNEKKLATKELTVVDAYKNYELSFDNKEGKVNVDNNVKVSVVDENGKVAEDVRGDAYAYVDSQSNKDAKVTVEFENGREKNAVNKGKFNIKVYANQPTTADIVVGVKAANGAVYAGTLTYTFGEESIPAGTSVVMTLGSTEMIVNNQLVDMKDAAPFAQDNRTFVPFRALGEALGAKVDYDQDAKTVTYKLGSSEIVMTLGSKDYTVNGVKKTMDVAPFAKDNRTYVPVRFVGEGLGFTVTGLTNANGQYVAVAFTK